MISPGDRVCACARAVSDWHAIPSKRLPSIVHWGDDGGMNSGLHRLAASLLAITIASGSGIGCGPEQDAGGSTTDAAATALDGESRGTECHPASFRADGSCCPSGHFYEASEDECAAIGPPECASTLPSNPAGCQPQWCASLRDPDGALCAPGATGCHPEGRLCTLDELAAGVGSPAGSWPDPGASGACRVAGSWGSDGVAPGELLAALPAPTAPAGTPPLVALPPTTETSFCTDEGGHTAICDPAPGSCGKGAMPGPDGQCLSVGVPWLCPPGFAVDPPGPGSDAGPARCKPDPSDCPADPFGDVVEGADVAFVDASAAPGGDGSRAAPWRSLADAITATTVHVVAIAAGTYVGPFLSAAPWKCEADARRW